jgi:glucose/mannose-6-phosphate isomerase
VLDHADGFASVDPSGMLGLVEEAGDQWRTAVQAEQPQPPSSWRSLSSVVVTGMGGSAIAGDLAASFFSRRWDVPVHVVRGYDLPAWVDAGALVIGCSYSGSTEETLSAWQQAGDRGLTRAVVSTGGILGAEAAAADLPLFRVPEGYPPRAALPSLLVTLTRVLAGVGSDGPESPGGKATLAELDRAPARLDEVRALYGRDIPVTDNPAKQLALWIDRGLVVVYAPEYPLGAVGMRWRGQFGENAKRLAAGHVVPEMNHNEIVGWEAQPDLYPQSRVVFLEDRDQGARIDLRIQTSVRLLEEAGAPVRRILSEGEGLLPRMISLVALGDYTSVYLAIGWGIDPTPVDKIDLLKAKLAEASS